MKPNFKFLVQMILIVCSWIPSAWAFQDNRYANFDRLLSAYQNLGKFSGSVLVVDKGQIIFEKSYGMANYELGVKNSSQTKYRLGSLSKQFTAISILQLKEKGLVDLNATVSQYLPYYPAQFAQKITVHQLLTHSSGIPDYIYFKELQPLMGLSMTPDQVIPYFMNRELNFEPGAQFEYSNSNYVILGAIIEKVTGQTYENYVKKNILQPSGLLETGFDRPNYLLSHRAAGYSFTPDYVLQNAKFLDPSIAHAAGALYSSVRDLFKWDQVILNGNLISAESKKLMTTPYIGDYGYGVFISKQNGHRRVYHTGAIIGYRTEYSKYVDDNASIIILSNLELFPLEQVSSGLNNILFNKPFELPKEIPVVNVDQNLLQKYVGSYQMLTGKDLFVNVSVENGKLYVDVSKYGKWRLFPASNTKFYHKMTDASVEFNVDEQGNIPYLTLHVLGYDIPSLRAGTKAKSKI